MEQGKFPKGAITWPEIRNFAYFAVFLVSVLAYTNGIANQVSLANEKLNVIDSRLATHTSKLDQLTTQSQQANDRLTKIETTLQINQKEGKISYATKSATINNRFISSLGL